MTRLFVVDLHLLKMIKKKQSKNIVANIMHFVWWNQRNQRHNNQRGINCHNSEWRSDSLNDWRSNNRTTDCQTSGLLTDWLAEMADWLTDWSTECLTDRRTCWLTDSLTYWLTDWLIDWLRWLTDWLIDWMPDWQVDVLTHWLTEKRAAEWLTV